MKCSQLQTTFMEAKALSTAECSVVVIKQEKIDEQPYTDMPWGYIDEGDTSEDVQKDEAVNPGESSEDQSLLDHSESSGEHSAEPPDWYATLKPFLCDQCPMAFDSEAQRKRHLLVHSPEVGNECPVCHKKFRCFYSLKKHAPTHSGDMSFECDVCGKRFPFKSEVERHKRVHTGEKPYKCPMCPSTFTNSGNMKVHIRTHTGEKPFQCLICGKAFSTSVKLRRHFSLHFGK